VVDYASGRYFLTLNAGSANYLDSTQSPAAGVWQHVAATYDGATARFYVDGVEVASRAFAGNVGDSNSWQIGAYGSSASGFFDGVIDEVRIYDRALTRSEIEGDMSIPVPRDTTPPRLTGLQPAEGAIDVPIAGPVTATFDEAMNPVTISTSTFELRDAGGNLVPAGVTYDPATRTASLVPASALSHEAVYRATVKGGASGSRATDLSGTRSPPSARGRSRPSRRLPRSSSSHRALTALVPTTPKSCGPKG
jgi:concanavalin A-like lectin/glucanase superfamily protein/Big-like domain-containing protein